MNELSTPDELAARMARLAAPEGRQDDAAPLRGCRVLEPSAGRGALLVALLDAGVDHVDCIEADLENANHLALVSRASLWANYRLQRGDFLVQARHLLGAYHAVVMFPPIEDGIAHVTAAWNLLAPGGKLVAILNAGYWYSNSHQCRVFRDWCAEIAAEDALLPAGTFASAGTSVALRILSARKPTPTARNAA